MAINLHNASMLDWLEAYNGPLFDSCVTDPPYELGFMGKAWDSTGIAFQVDTWRKVYDALKPGAHLVAFSGTRTYHRMAVAIEDAGFEIRDQLAWTYGSGFPKSHDISKAIDKAAGADRPVIGEKRGGSALTMGGDNSRPWHEAQKARGGAYDVTAPATPEAKKWNGYGTALKPAWEPICLARKPIDQKTTAANVVMHGTGALNIDGCRVGTEGGVRKIAPDRSGASHGGSGFGCNGATEEIGGRWPANLLHDGSDEVLAGFPETESGKMAAGTVRQNRSGYAGVIPPITLADTIGDSGSAARFFYSAKAGPLDRIGTAHATVKPVDLMRWLCRLITPQGGHILEPFAGSGTTGIAAMAEGFDCTMIELIAEHAADIERKLEYLKGNGGHNLIERHKARIER